ncbi:MAG: hypothetical protein EA383_00875 [Spirochaetaceae bacterium]|nr:MAG: hypothetical protein EA383_00875 [Spirochaetaceae bacterium]
MGTNRLLLVTITIVAVLSLLSCELIFTDHALPPMSERIERVTNLGAVFGGTQPDQYRLAASRTVRDGVGINAVSVLGPSPGGRQVAVTLDGSSLDPFETVVVDEILQVLTRPDGSLTLVEPRDDPGGGTVPLTPVWHIGDLDGNEIEPGYINIQNTVDGTPQIVFLSPLSEAAFDAEQEPASVFPIDLGVPVSTSSGFLRAITAAVSAPRPVAYTVGDPTAWLEDTYVSLTLEVVTGDERDALIVSRFPAAMLHGWASGMVTDEFFISVSSVLFEREFLFFDGRSAAQSVFFTREAAIAVTSDRRMVRVPFGDSPGDVLEVGFGNEGAIEQEIAIGDPREYLFAVSPEGSRIFFYSAQRAKLYAARPFW